MDSNQFLQLNEPEDDMSWTQWLTPEGLLACGITTSIPQPNTNNEQQQQDASTFDAAPVTVANNQQQQHVAPLSVAQAEEAQRGKKCSPHYCESQSPLSVYPEFEPHMPSKSELDMPGALTAPKNVTAENRESLPDKVTRKKRFRLFKLVERLDLMKALDTALAAVLEAKHAELATLEATLEANMKRMEEIDRSRQDDIPQPTVILKRLEMDFAKETSEAQAAQHQQPLATQQPLRPQQPLAPERSLATQQSLAPQQPLTPQQPLAPQQSIVPEQCFAPLATEQDLTCPHFWPTTQSAAPFSLDFQSQPLPDWTGFDDTAIFLTPDDFSQQQDVQGFDFTLQPSSTSVTVSNVVDVSEDSHANQTSQSQPQQAQQAQPTQSACKRKQEETEETDGPKPGYRKHKRPRAPRTKPGPRKFEEY